MKKILAIFMAMLIAVSCLTVMPFAHDVTVTLGGTEYVEESVVTFTNVMDSDKNPYAVAGFEPANETYTFARNNYESKGIASADAIEGYWADGYYLKLVVSAGTVSSTTLRLQEDGGSYTYVEVNGVAAGGATYYDLGEAWDKFAEAGYTESYGRGNLRVKDEGLTIASLEIVKLTEETGADAFVIPGGEEQVYSAEINKANASWGTWWFNNDSNFWAAANAEGAKMYVELDPSWADAGYYMLVSMNDGSSEPDGRVEVSSANGVLVDGYDNVVSYDIKALVDAYVAAGGTASSYAVQSNLASEIAEGTYTIVRIYVTTPEAVDPGPGDEPAEDVITIAGIDYTETRQFFNLVETLNAPDGVNGVVADGIVYDDWNVGWALILITSYIDGTNMTNFRTALAKDGAYIKITYAGTNPVNMVLQGSADGAYPWVGVNPVITVAEGEYNAAYFEAASVIADYTSGTGLTLNQLMNVSIGGAGDTIYGFEVVKLEQVPMTPEETEAYYNKISNIPVSVKVYGQDTATWSKWIDNGIINGTYGTAVAIDCDATNVYEFGADNTADFTVAPIFGFELGNPDFLKLPDDAEAGDKGESGKFSYDISEVVITAEGYDNVVIPATNVTKVLTVEKTAWGTGGNTISVNFVPEIMEQLGLADVEALCTYLAAVTNVEGTVTLTAFNNITPEIIDAFFNPPVDDEPTEAMKRVGWFTTGPETHAFIIGRAIITMEHTFDENGKCTLCRYETDLVAEEVEVELSYESETEETEDVEVTDTKENPDTGLALAMVPAAIALAVVAFKKR